MTSAHTTCQRCGTPLDVPKGESRRCFCGATILHNPADDAPFASFHPPRRPGWRRA